MSKTPPIPKEQRSFRGQRADIEGATSTDARPSGPARAETNLAEQGRQGNIRQNTTHQGNVQDR
jgi:hypothetical protein